MAMKNRILAMPAVAAEIPVKPKTPVPLPKPPPITGNLPAPPSRTTKAQPITPKRTK